MHTEMLTGAGIDARCHLQEARPKSHQGDQGFRYQVNGTTYLSSLSRIAYLTRAGYDRCPSRPTVEQEGLGVWYQGCAVPSSCPHFTQEKRRGEQQGASVQLRAGCECQERQGSFHNSRRGIEDAYMIMFGRAWDQGVCIRLQWISY